ncbi:MAG: hypothetical protein AAF514_05850 [Verrucomicrobiota bacterium]
MKSEKLSRAEAGERALAANPTRNVATFSADQARNYAEEILGPRTTLDAILPNFDRNYRVLQKKLKLAKNIPRIQMPVIEPEDMERFDQRLQSGSLDIFAPYARGKLPVPPTNLAEGAKWITLGVQDGDPKDDVIRANWTFLAAMDLLPLQSQIWLEKLVGNIAKFGPATPESPLLKTTVIVSKEGYILDGHHRYGQIMLANPKLRIRALHIPLDIDTLLRISRDYGSAIGHAPKT